MSKLVKSLYLTILTIIALFSFVIVISTTTYFGKAQDEVLENIAFEMKDGAQIIFDIDSNGEPKKETAKISFLATMDIDTYENLLKTEQGKVFFGVLVASYDDVKNNGITTENVFGEDRIYTFDSFETSKILIEKFEQTSLTIDNVRGYCYMQAFVDNITDEIADEQFIAVPYLKTVNDFEEFSYSVKEFKHANARSFSYLAQKAEEKENTPNYIKDLLDDEYIKGFTENIVVNYVKNYSGLKLSSSVVLTCDLGEELSAEIIADRLAEMQVVDPSAYSDGNVSIKLNGKKVENIKVYANGKTNAEISASYSAIENTSSYSIVNGYFVTDNFASLSLNSNKKASYNVDYGYANGEKNTGKYLLYLDGTFKLDIDNVGAYLGQYDINTGNFNIEVNGKKHDYKAVVELSTVVYEKLRGVYHGGDDKIIINSNGTLNKNLEIDGNYLLTYSDGEFRLNMTLLDDESTAKLVYDDASKKYQFELDGVTYTQSEDKLMADESAYESFANTYAGKFGLPVGNDANKISTNTYDGSITFLSNGTLLYNGLDAHVEDIVGYNNGGYEAPKALMVSERIGKYVLYDDGSLDLFIPQISTCSKVNGKMYNEVEDVFASGTYSDNKVTLNTEEFNMFYKEKVYTLVEKVQFGELYEEFAGTYIDSTKKWKTDGNWELTFNSDGTITSNRKWAGNPGSKVEIDGEMVEQWYGTYTLNPITENYGTVNVILNYHIKNGNYTNHIQYYVRYEDRYVLRLSYSNGGMEYNHFIDVVQKGDDFSTMPVFETLAGNGGTEEKPVQTIYKDANKNASLTLINNGVWGVPRVNGELFDKNSIVYNPGGMCKFNDGTTEITANYNLVALTKNSGKILMTMAETGLRYNVTTAKEDRFPVGDYVINEERMQISFTYLGVDYTFVTGISNETFAGDYVGHGKTLTLNSDLTALYDGIKTSYNFIPETIYSGKIILLDKGVEKEAIYTITGSNVKITFNDSVYIKKSLNLDELYSKYAGTYTATYEGGRTMTLVLKDDGTLSGTGTGPNLDNRSLFNWASSTVSPTDMPDKHLGSVARVGNYTFTMIDGQLQIIFNFDECNIEQEWGTNTQAINATSGYYAVMISPIGGASASGVPNEWNNFAIWDVYNYATGSASADCELRVMFEAFSDTPITLIKNK